MKMKILLAGVMAAGVLMAAPALSPNLVDDALVAKKAGNFAKAIALFEQARSLEPDNVALLAQLGTVQGWAGRYSDALRTYELGLQLRPNDSDLRLGRASVLAWSG